MSRTIPADSHSFVCSHLQRQQAIAKEDKQLESQYFNEGSDQHQSAQVEEKEIKHECRFVRKRGQEDKGLIHLKRRREKNRLKSQRARKRKKMMIENLQVTLKEVNDQNLLLREENGRLKRKAAEMQLYLPSLSSSTRIFHAGGYAGTALLGSCSHDHGNSQKITSITNAYQHLKVPLDSPLSSTFIMQRGQPNYRPYLPMELQADSMVGEGDYINHLKHFP